MSYDDCEEALSVAERQIADLEDEREELREALKKHGRHAPMCFGHTASSACTCGLSKSLKIGAK